MSKFFKRISELTRPETSEEKEEREKAEALAKMEVDVDSGENKNPEDQRMVRAKKNKDTKIRQAIKKDLALAKVKVNEAGPEDFVPRPTPGVPGGGAPPPFIPAAPPGAPPVPGVPPGAGRPPEKADPLTTEGETWLVNLARKALFIDIDKVGLTDAERELIAKEVTPKNAKKAAKIIHNINVNYGLSEKFDSKIDNLIEDFKKKKSEFHKADGTGSVKVLVPGSFKPPHKGHYEMVKHYSTQHPQAQVEVLVSAPAGNSIRKTKDGKIITAAVAKQIFELYIVGNRKMGVPPLTNVHVRISEYPSPVTAAYEALKTFYPGTTVILGASKKDDDWKRWQSAIPWAEKEGLGLNIEDPYTSAVDVVASDEGRVYSASNIRDNFDNFDAIKPDIPDHVNPAHIKEIFDEIIPGEV